MDVRKFQRIQEIAPHLAYLGARHRPPYQSVGDGLTFQELRRVVGKPVRLVGVVDRNDVSVGQIGQRAALFAEPLHGDGRVHLWSDDLGRHESVKFSLVGEHNYAHAAAAELAEHLVALRRQSGTHPLEERGHDWPAEHPGPRGESQTAPVGPGPFVSRRFLCLLDRDRDMHPKRDVRQAIALVDPGWGASERDVVLLIRLCDERPRQITHRVRHPLL